MHDRTIEARFASENSRHLRRHCDSSTGLASPALTDTTRGFYCPPRTGRLPPRRSGDTEIAEYGASSSARFRWPGCLYVRVGNAVTGRCREVMPLTVTLRPPARQYTVSSTASGTRLQIIVGRVRGVNGAPDGRVSSFVQDQLTVGDVLDVSAPAGDFVVESSSEPLLLASAGAGTTTVLPIVEHIARTQPQRKVIVAHADQTAQDHALRTTVLHVGRQIDDFTSYTWYESVDPEDDESRQGLMDLSDVPLPDDVQVFTCGPLPFMRHVRSTLLTRGVPASRIRYEVFGPDLWAVQAPAEPASP
jgi:ferredoxin-NADP reductase